MCVGWGRKEKEFLILSFQQALAPGPRGAQKGIKKTKKNLRKEAVSPGSTPSLLSPRDLSLFVLVNGSQDLKKREGERERERCCC